MKNIRACEGLLPERSVSVKEARGTKMTQVNARMATAEEMAARSIVYHAFGTADGDKVCYPWLVS